MRRSFFALISTALMTMTLPCVVTGQRVQRTGPSVLDSLAAQLVELELQRVSPSDGPTQRIGLPRDIGLEIADLHERLRALPEGATADRDANQRVLLALEARAVTVQARIQQLRLYYTEAHPLVRNSRLEERAIDQRRSELRRSS
jgi:hypothetical protein